MRKQDGDAAMNDVAIKILKGELEPELLTKFESECKRLAKDGEALDPSLKQALKGMLQMMAAYKDKLQTPQLQALAHLVGFTGNLMSGGDGSTPPDPAAGNTEDPPDEQDDPDNGGPDPFSANADPTGKDGSTPPAPPSGNPDDKDPANKPPFGKRGGTVSTEFEAFKKAAAKENDALRKSQEELRKANDAIRLQLRKKEVQEMVTKKYPNLGGNSQITDMVLELEEKGILKSWEPRLDAWNAQLESSSLFGEMGSGGRSGDDLTLEEQLNSKARDLQKSDPKLSFAKAYTLAYEQNPELRTAMQKRDRARLNAQ